MTTKDLLDAIGRVRDCERAKNGETDADFRAALDALYDLYVESLLEAR